MSSGSSSSSTCLLSELAIRRSTYNGQERDGTNSSVCLWYAGGSLKLNEVGVFVELEW